MSNRTRKKRFKRETILVGLAAIALVFGFFQFRAWSKGKNLTEVYFVSEAGEKTQGYMVELATNPGARQKGLMFRKPDEMPTNHGMLFVFPEQEVQSFWMKNTYISLDMIFIDQDRKVVGILESVPVLNEKSRKVKEESLYVLELHAGQAKAAGIRQGMRLETSSALPKGV